MDRHVPVAPGGPRLTPAAGLTLLVVSVILMLTGLLMLISGMSAGSAIPLIAIGIALTAIVQIDKRRRPKAG